jgi:hypothetical protein
MLFFDFVLVKSHQVPFQAVPDVVPSIDVCQLVAGAVDIITGIGVTVLKVVRTVT